MIITLENFTKSYGEKQLFAGVNLSMDAGDKVGIVGVNGTGKSTFLKAIAGLVPVDDGTMVTMRGLRIEYLAQDKVFDPEHTVLMEVFRGMTPLMDALRGYELALAEAAKDPESPAIQKRIMQYAERIDELDGWQVESTAKKLKKNADFQKIADDGDVNASVLYGQEEVSRLFQVTNYIRIAAVVLVGLLTFIAFIFINNTIRLSITARRREIAIMRLVGASNGFIRGPFITEGVLQAILGSLLSIGVLELLRNLMIPRLQESIGWMSFALPMQYYLVTYAALILVGVIIGLFGSAIAMRRYLRV